MTGSSDSDPKGTDLPFIAAQLAPGSECDCRTDIPVEPIDVEWEEEFCRKEATIIKCKNCDGVRGFSEVRSQAFRDFYE